MSENHWTTYSVQEKAKSKQLHDIVEKHGQSIDVDWLILSKFEFEEYIHIIVKKPNLEKPSCCFMYSFYLLNVLLKKLS